MVEALVLGASWYSFGFLCLVFVVVDGYAFAACCHVGIFVDTERNVIAFGVSGDVCCLIGGWGCANAWGCGWTF